MRLLIKNIIIYFLLLISAQLTFAEDGISVTCDLANRYVWRGTDFGNSPSIQPGLSYTSGPLTVGAWSAWQFSGQADENDLYVSYAAGPVTVTLTDYFFPGDDPTVDGGFTTFDADTGGHFLEAAVSGELSGVGYTGGYMFLEPDGDINSDVDPSIYLGLSYGPFMLGLGSGVYTAQDEDNGDDKFDVVEVGVTGSNDKYSCSWIFNPNQKTTFLVVAMSL